MVKNYTIPFNSRWSRDPWFSTHTGYEESPDRRPRKSDTKNARSGTAQYCGQEQEQKVTLTDAILPATQANHHGKGDIVGRKFQTIPVSLRGAENKKNAESRPNTAKQKQKARRQERKHRAWQKREKRKRDDLLINVHQPSEKERNSSHR